MAEVPCACYWLLSLLLDPNRSGATIPPLNPFTILSLQATVAMNVLTQSQIYSYYLSLVLAQCSNESRTNIPSNKATHSKYQDGCAIFGGCTVSSTLHFFLRSRKPQEHKVLHVFMGLVLTRTISVSWCLC